MSAISAHLAVVWSVVLVPDCTMVGGVGLSTGGGAGCGVAGSVFGGAVEVDGRPHDVAPR
jgi:hypothetical protein